jgi:hypothetical protein
MPLVPFDPYLNWLGIPPHEQPPNFYRLLGVVLFESNTDVIQQAANRQSLRVGAFLSGPQGEMCQQLLNEIAVAQFCLLDPGQKAAYDNNLNETLSHKGERAVAAPPPPASMSGGTQFSSPSPALSAQPVFGAPAPQFVSPAPQYGNAAGRFNQPAQFHQPGPVAQGTMNLPAPPPPLMQMPAMPAPQGFMPAMSRTAVPAAPAAMPVAAPFPSPIPRPAAPVTAPRPSAPPATPPAAPQRPIDELESLTSQTSVRRRVLKKSKKKDYGKEIVIGTVVAVGAAVLGLIYLAYASQDHSKRGFDAIQNEATNEPSLKAINSARKAAEEQKRKDKEREREKKAAAASGLGDSSARPRGSSIDLPKNQPARPATQVDSPMGPPINPGRPPHAMDSPAAGQAASPPDQGHDTPQDLGGVNDPVMDTQSPK